MLAKNRSNDEVSEGSAVTVAEKDPINLDQRSKLRFQEYRSWDELALIRTAWGELLAESSSRTIFLTWEWLKPWWDAFGEGRQIIALAASDDEGGLAGLALLSSERRRIVTGITLKTLRLLGDGSTDSDTLDFIVREGYEGPFVKSVLDWCAQHESEWDILELNTVPQPSAVARELQNEFAARGWVCWQRENVHQIVALPGKWEEYLSSLSKNMRASVNSKMRKLEKRYQVQRRKCESPEELSEFLDQLYRMHTMRWSLLEQSGSFFLPARRQFYTEMARAFLQRGWLDFWLLELNGKPAAAEFGFHYGKTYYFLQTGFDPAYFADSVGFVLKAQIFRELIKQGMEAYDFLGDDDPYKQRWAPQTHTTLFRTCARPGTRGSLFIGLTRSANRSKAWLRARFPKQAWETLRGNYRRLLAKRQAAPKNGPAPEQSGEE
jgi:CelD/BcsL family acetyltransferase involved in cellulose biosynthesis